MNRVTKVALASILSLGTFAAPSQAVTTLTTSMGVSAAVASGCTIVALPLAFGAYDNTAASPNDAATTVTVLCTVGTAYNVGLNAGTGTGASIATRKLTSGANTLDYTLYSDSGRTTVWGTTIGTNTVSGTYALLQPALNVYGRIGAGQNVASGAYTDTVTVSITY